MKGLAVKRFARFEVIYDDQGVAQAGRFIPLSGQSVTSCFAGAGGGGASHAQMVQFPAKTVEYSAKQIEAALQISRLHEEDRVLLLRAYETMKKKPSCFRKIKNALKRALP